MLLLDAVLGGDVTLMRPNADANDGSSLRPSEAGRAPAEAGVWGGVQWKG